MASLAFIGTIIGAGFASGQEIKMYFVNYGLYGLISLVLMIVLFIIFGEKIMMMGYTSKSDSYETILGYGFKCKFKKIIDYVFSFFLIATASTMFSGCGAFFYQTVGIPAPIGGAAVAILTYFITVLGIKGIMAISSVEVPLLIAITLFVAISSINNADLTSFSLINELKFSGFIPAIISSIIYTSYNLIMGLSILPALGNAAKSKKQIRITAIISGIVIGFLGYIIYLALLVNYDRIHGVEIPVLELAGGSYGLIYGVLFLLAVLSTAVGTLYGVYARINKNTYYFALICGISYLFSLFGFSALVANLYFFMGVFGIFVITMIVIGHNKSKSQKREA